MSRKCDTLPKSVMIPKVGKGCFDKNIADGADGKGTNPCCGVGHLNYTFTGNTHEQYNEHTDSRLAKSVRVYHAALVCLRNGHVSGYPFDLAGTTRLNDESHASVRQKAYATVWAYWGYQLKGYTKKQQAEIQGLVQQVKDWLGEA